CVAGPYELIAGDAFGLDADILAGCTAIYDRAALIALPPDLRHRYAATVWRHPPPGCTGLLVTLEYPQHEKDGPPFSVEQPEVRQLLEPDWRITLLERRDILADEPGFRDAGVSALHTTVYKATRPPP